MKVRLRYRARADESIETRHQQVMNGLTLIDPPWGLKGQIPPPAPAGRPEIESQVNLAPHLGAGLLGGLFYLLRSEDYLRDEAEFDDLLLLKFEPDRVDYANLARSVFPQYVQDFSPYRGTIILDDDLARDDWDEIVRLGKETGKDVDGRDGVYRINPVNYFDRELCRRAFKLSPEQIVSRLQGKVELASLLLDGVLLIVTAELLDRAALEKIDDVVHNHLEVGRQ